MRWTATAPSSLHAGPLEALGFDPPAVRRLASYLDLLAAWNERINLTGARTAGERVAILVGRVRPALALPECGSLIDVGSGNGSPGLVFALAREDLEVTLLEPRSRRWAFLTQATRAAGRPDVRVLKRRHDQYGGPPARTVTVRGLAVPLGELGPLVAHGGRLLVFGGAPRPQPPFEAEPLAAAADVHVFRRLGDVPRET